MYAHCLARFYGMENQTCEQNSFTISFVNFHQGLFVAKELGRII